MFQIIKLFTTGLVGRGMSFVRFVVSAIVSFIKCLVTIFLALFKAVSYRVAIFILALATSATTFASSTGAGGFTKATTEISSYQTPVSNLMKAIAAVIVLVGAFNVYFKMQNGDQDVKKTIVI